MRGARPGDVLVANGYVRFYVTGRPDADGYVSFAGWVIDADVARDSGEVDQDGLDAYVPLVNVSPIAAADVVIERDGSDGGEARVRVEGRLEAVPYVLGLRGATPNPVPVDVTLTYVLGPNDRALRVETRVVNGTGAAQTIEVGDLLQLSDDEAQAYSVPGGFDVLSSARQVDAVGAAHAWRPVAYALFRTGSQLALFNGSSVSDQIYGGDSAMWGVTIDQRTLAPGAALEVTRYLAVASDASHALAERLRLAAAPTARVHGRVHVADRAVAGARVSLFKDSELSVFAGQVVTTANGGFDVTVEPGHYYAVATGRSNSETVAVPLRQRELAEGHTRSAVRELDAVSRDNSAPEEPGILADGSVDLELGDHAHVKITLRDADGSRTAGKLVFQAEDERQAVLASAGERVPNPTTRVRQLAWVATGDIELDVEPGVYTIIASRGYDSSWDVQSGIALLAGQTRELLFTVARVVEHAGYVAIDSHVHGIYSQHGDASVSERVITAAAEGLRVHVATDHDWIANYGPAVAVAGLSGRLLSFAGVELTTPHGHHCMWPLESDPTSSRGGAVRWWDGGTIAGWYAQYREKGAVVRQVAHGADYFAGAGYDSATGTVQDDSQFTWDFNAMEVHNGKGGGGREQLVPIWLSLMRFHHRVAPLGASDSHTRAFEAGAARTYVGIDDGPQLSAADIARAVTELRTVASTGPFIHFRARAGRKRAEVGETLALRATDKVTLEIRVDAPSWMPISNVELLRDGEVIEEWSATTEPRVGLITERAQWFAHSLTVQPDADTWYVVQVHGEDELSPVYPGIKPWALTAPIFIEVAP
jgi:hypothetical protein